MLFKLNKRSKLSILFWKSIVPANSAAIQFNNSAFYHPLKCHPKKSHFWQQKSKKKFHCQSSRIEWNRWTKTCLTTIEYWLYFFFRMEIGAGSTMHICLYISEYYDEISFPSSPIQKRNFQCVWLYTKKFRWSSSMSHFGFVFCFTFFFSSSYNFFCDKIYDLRCCNCMIAKSVVLIWTV